MSTSQHPHAEEFQYALYKSGATNCTHAMPCNAAELSAKINSRKEAAEKAVAKAAATPAPPPGPRVQSFYMYRAQSKATYPLENINTADLAGVFWYLHQEVIVATPRKYSIDRIKRYKAQGLNACARVPDRSTSVPLGASASLDAGCAPRHSVSGASWSWRA